ncbi:MAG: hypothetical protein EAZ55_09070 [Cytophagales bacterium]|nr:MAG: hypothetical protein EAZ55_09070 [Cytophagales bacterium]
MIICSKKETHIMKTQPQLKLQNLFGFPFPEDFFQFQDWLQKHPQEVAIASRQAFDKENERHKK